MNWASWSSGLKPGRTFFRRSSKMFAGGKELDQDVTLGVEALIDLSNRAGESASPDDRSRITEIRVSFPKSVLQCRATS